ncbi:methyl-accepting chemotaxis protein [Rhodopseudomonas palustris]|uniref:methyl-accepting chemotaxis protein n=1 Tax=Rhodopseudomonas palustris TaxID=1076 RepID=UPI002ACD741E|nr:methyl-accepting chemotaxis protein [Rhodopseudomonas palustris]WQH00115.1 methyl-accepting chemotaxis protein [Rhodopseudomonas palustris]
MSILSSASKALRGSSEASVGDSALMKELVDKRARDEAIAACLHRIAEGHYDVAVPAGDDALTRAIDTLLQRLSASASRDLDRMVDLSIQGSETAMSSAYLLSSTRKIDQRTQALASASEEMVASIGQIRATAEAAAAQASEMRVSADRGMTTASSASSAMGRVSATAELASEKITALSEASEAIGSIVGSIDAIARQTNLLALNATIEAARAGEAGRGFAVVATEVKSLSQQTSNATVDIRSRIERLREDIATIVAAMADCTNAAVESRGVVNTLGEAMSGVSDRVAGVTNGMSEIAGILNQQSEASREIATGISAIAEMTKKSVGQVGDISNQLDRVQATADQELVELSQMSFDHQIQRLAKADHIGWKKRLCDMAVGRAKLNADELTDHHSCRLGKWYYGDGSLESRNHPAFRALEKPHALVHDHGKKAARLFQSGDLAGAIAEIECVGDASKDVLRLLDDLVK